LLNSNPSGALDGFIARYSATNGALLQQFDITSGGTIDIKSMQSAENGDIYIAGQFAQTVDLDFGSGTRQAISNVNSGDAFVGRYTTDLDLIWVNPIGSMTPAIDYFSDVKISPDGGVYVTGLIGGLADIDPGAGQTNLNGAIDAVLIRYDRADGSLDWGFLLGGNSVDLGVSLMLTEEMDIIVTGSMNSSSLDADPGPGVVNINKTGSVATPFVLRYSSSATYINGFAYDASNVSSLNVNRMIPSYGGTIIVLGNFTGSFDVNPGTGTETIQSQGGSTDAFFIQYEPDWSPSRKVQISGAGAENLNDALVSGIYLYGVAQFENQCFPQSGSSEVVSAVGDGLDAAFMVWNTNPEVLENTPAHNKQLLLYPNPAENFVIISGCTPQEEVVITDITGRTIHPAMAGNKADVSNLANGVYTIHVLRTDGVLSTSKLLIQNK
ncbi:MAG: T9SS type A sorting domain-containing protein, partial [Bacteroidetes bacterium]|nr:T9SS type A sorting domain-containing protein [Bacteroidota bacterium]